MAYTVTFGNGGRPAKYREYEIDSPDDLTVIGSDADAGSIAHSRSNNTTYKLGNDRGVALGGSGGGGGGGESPFFDCDISVSEDPQTYDFVYTLESTFADLSAAALAGKAIIIHITYDDPSLGYPTRLVADSVGITGNAEQEITYVTLYLTKGVVFGNKPYISQTAYAIAADGTIEYTFDSIELTKA